MPYALSGARHQAKFRGEVVRVEAAQLRVLAERWRNAPPASTARPFHWSVAISLSAGVQTVPLKWLVSQLVGLPPGQFSTSQATALLRALGLQNAIFSNFSENGGD